MNGMVNELASNLDESSQNIEPETEGHFTSSVSSVFLKGDYYLLYNFIPQPALSEGGFFYA